MGTTWLFPLAPAQLFLGRRRSPLAGSRSGQATADVDQVVGDHSQAHPALHPSEPSISASIQPVASLQHADATLTARPPLLTLAEPSSLLIGPALLAACAPIGNRNPLHSQRLDRFFVLPRVEGRIGGHQQTSARLGVGAATPSLLAAPAPPDARSAASPSAASYTL